MILNLIRFVARGPIIQPLALLAVGGAVGFWFGVGEVSGAGRILAAAILAFAAIAAIIWRYRDHAQRRWQGLLNEYAEREIARARGLRVSPVRR